MITAATAPPRLKTVVLLGNPNTGKTTLFNVLCNTRLRTANYPGVTVERYAGLLRLGDGEVQLVDLPGTYSLKADSFDEEVVVDALLGRVANVPQPDAVIVVLDASNLRRNLYLFTQAAELGLPMLGALTMTDTLAEAGIALDVAELSRRLGVPLVDVGGARAEGIDELKGHIAELLARGPSTAAARPSFPAPLERLTDELLANLSPGKLSRLEARNLLLHRGVVLESVLGEDGQARALLAGLRVRAREAGVGAPAAVAGARYAWITRTLEGVEARAPRGPTRSERIDRWLTHRLFGPPIFAGIMYVVFASIYSWAAPLMDGIEAVFSGTAAFAAGFLQGMPTLQSLVGDGIIGGVGSVVVFLPQIVFLFCFVAVLEDSGYLARAALMMDRLLSWTGLNGRAFIPMLSSFACAVPGVMSARVMADPRARLTTILTAPLMSCSARLPVYVLMIGAFIEPLWGPLVAGLALFLMHGVGTIVALPVAFILNRGVLRTPTIPFVLELPPYRVPHWKSVLYRVTGASRKFLVRSGTIIFALAVVIWALTYFPRPETVRSSIEGQYTAPLTQARVAGDNDRVRALTNERESRIASGYLEQSYLGRAGQFAQPLFAPLGYDWKITVGILGAFPAREVIIATLGIIYSVGDASEDSKDLRETMRSERRPDGRPVFTPLTAVSIMIFFALCCQCLSTVVTVQRETGSWWWAGFLFTYMTVLAYVTALVVYQAGRALGWP